MTRDPFTAALDQLAAHHEQIGQLDAREAAHFTSLAEQLTHLAGLLTTVAQALQDDTAALARVEAIERQVAALAGRLEKSGNGHQPAPAPAWWKLAGDERQEALAQLQAWVKQVYRPGYGHLAVPLASCWQAHDLCLYGLDILSQLWSALYLQDERSSGLLSAQAEYQARILPAIAAQMMAETTGCGHDQPHPQPANYSQRRP
jgi:hypothetical protein